jgi:hypothetical protein
MVFLSWVLYRPTSFRLFFFSSQLLQGRPPSIRKINSSEKNTGKGKSQTGEDRERVIETKKEGKGGDKEGKLHSNEKESTDLDRE